MPTMYENVLNEEIIRFIDSIPQEIGRRFYLAGGTGLALQIGHRTSYDMDFFSDEAFNNLKIKSDLLRKWLSIKP